MDGHSALEQRGKFIICDFSLQLNEKKREYGIVKSREKQISLLPFLPLIEI
jgi:hypothetical protein